MALAPLPFLDYFASPLNARYLLSSSNNSQTSISDPKLPANEDVANEDRKLAALALTTATDEGEYLLKRWTPLLY